ncbi:hypothetical protein LH128_01247 [Sphingomonas sp. LH128]|uniref:hypothetical protein n=1 Tax=Sphingomonas sp. LH128 TaxID=473781 RepID=UPI00027CC48B|nr:hypothetical protein [Sphingomonas sp. LH128]EJU14959.1 hypothetical protein LH128_01247 [Sphingomonas sp. LH128]
MRMMMNQPLMAAKQTFDAANARVDWEDAHINHPEHPSDEESIKDAAEHLQQALWDYVATPAYNGREILLKLEELLDHTPEWRDHASAIERDLTDAARPQPSRPMFAAFHAFRDAWIAQGEQDLSQRATNSEEIRLHDVVFSAVKVVFAIPCATPGDFLVKAYVNLLWHTGHTAGFDGRPVATGSFFDPDLLNIDTDSLVSDEFFRKAYIDLSECDLGACLIATGHINFDPPAWLARADTIGLPISLIVKPDGGRSLCFGVIDTDDERVQREERRLQQILNFAGQRRWKAIADFITEHRKDLICVVSPNIKAEAA